MNFYFCEKCGKRLTEKEIQSGAGRDKKLRGVYCAGCAVGVMTMETLPLSDSEARAILKEEALSKSGSSPALRKTGQHAPTLHSGKRTAIQDTTRASSLAPALRSVQSAHPPQASRARGTMAMLVLGGALFVLGFGFLLFKRGEPAVPRKAEPAPAHTNLAQADRQERPPAPPAIPVPAPTAAPELKAQPATTPAPAVDIREEFARRRLDELLAQQKSGALQPYLLRKQFEEFVAGYAGTQAGREAAEVLKAMPMVDPPAETKVEAKPPEPAPAIGVPAPTPGPAPAAAAPAPAVEGEYTVLYRWRMDKDGPGPWKAGAKDEKVTAPGSNASWQSDVLADKWFTGKVSISMPKGIKISNETFLRIHVRLEGTRNIMVHSPIGTSVYEKHLAGITGGRWAWIGFKLSTYTRALHGGVCTPPAGSEFQGTTLYSGTNGKASTLWIDELVIGDGKLPPDSP